MVGRGGGGGGSGMEQNVFIRISHLIELMVVVRFGLDYLLLSWKSNSRYLPNEVSEQIACHLDDTLYHVGCC